MRELQALSGGHLNLDFADWEEFLETFSRNRLTSDILVW